MTRKRVEDLPKTEPTPKRRETGQDKTSSDSPLTFLEQITTLFKLRLLKSRLEVDKIDEKQVGELEAKLGGTDEERVEAESAIGELYRKVFVVDQATFHKEVTLEQTLRETGVSDDELIGRSRQMDARINDLRTKGPDKVTEKDVDDSIANLKEISDRLGVEIGVEKEKIDRTVGKEVGELHMLRDRIQISKQRNEIVEVASKKDQTKKKAKKDKFLAEEDFKDNPEESKKVMRIKRGTREHQREADKYVGDLKRDFSGDQLERTDETYLAEGFLNSKTQNRRRLRYGDGFEGIERADDFTFRAGLIYSDELVEKIVDRALRNVPKGTQRDLLETQLRGVATLGVVEVWTSKRKDLTPEDVVGVIEQHIQTIGERGDRKRKQRATSVDEELDPLDPLESMGQVSRWGGSLRQGMEELDELARRVNFDIGKEISAFTSKKQEFAKQALDGSENSGRFAKEFIEGLRERYPKEDDETYLKLYGSIEGMFGNQHYVFLKEKLNNMDYEGYLKYLMSYLYKVGLREGHQDFQLQIMMREARTTFATVGRKDLLDIYDAFEKTAIFHDSYFQLDREGYAKVLNSWGVEPLQVFKNKEANKLNVRVAKENGDLLNELSVIKFDDMMQSRVWAHRLIYGTKGEIYDADRVYDDMIVTQIYGGPDKVLRVVGEEIKDVVTGEVVARLTDKLVVDGDKNRPVTLETLLIDSKYLVGTAHDMWRLDGRIANILDDVKIGDALGANKGLLTVWKIKRYAEEYGFISPYMFEALELDNFIYEIENYKDLVNAGMQELFKDKGGDGKKVAGILNDHIRRLRELRDEQFRTNYLPIEDVRLLSMKSLGWDEAKVEYLKREALMGNKIEWNNLSKDDKAVYSEQITNLHKKWTRNLLSTSERAIVDGVDWARVNAEYAKILGVESIGSTFEDFIKNFSFGRLSSTQKFRGTDLQDYGGYYLKSGAVVDIYKGGLGGGATEAIAKAFGTMEGYLPYDKSGFRRFAMKEMEVMYSWDDRHFSVEIPETNADGSMSGGKRLPNGEIMTDEMGQWAHKKERKILWGQSLLEEGRMRRPRNERDIEYAAYSMVGSGTLDRAAVEEFLDLKYGGWLKGIKWDGIKIKKNGREIVLIKPSRPFARMWRWFKRTLWLDDPVVLFEAAWDDGKKAVGGAMKYIFG